MGLLRIRIVLILVCSSALVHAGGGWTNPKGEGYFKLGQWMSVADQHYTDQALLDPNVTTGLYMTSFYGEYGFTNRLTGVLYAPFFVRNTVNNIVSSVNDEVLSKGDAINAVGDFDLALKYGILKNKKWVLASTINFGLPLGKTSAGRDGNLQTGDGEFNQMLKFDLSRGWDLKVKDSTVVGFYTNIYAGYNNRTNNFSDEYRLGLEAGFGLLNKKLWLVFRSDLLKSLYNGATAEQVTSTSVFANNTEYLSLSLEVAYALSNKVGLSAGYATVAYGKIIMAAPAYSFGVYYKLKK